MVILESPQKTVHDEQIDYLDSDGEPMAETDFQYKYLVYCRNTLDLHFQSNPQTYVSGNLLIYYEKGNPRRSISPDVFVVFGIPKRDRPIYQVWVEGKAPDVVIEITSKTTEQKDRVFKSTLYSRLGVKEYFMYDPTGDYLDPALQGFWLDEDGTYQPIGADKVGEVLKLDSHLLKLELHLEAGHLRLYNSDTQAYLMSHAEEQATRLEAEHVAKSALERAEAEFQARIQSDQARLEAETVAQSALARADQAEARAQVEMTTRLELEARLRELEAKLTAQ